MAGYGFSVDTAANWQANNPTPNLDEECVESDTLARKLGDGVTPYNGLLYEVQKFPSGILALTNLTSNRILFGPGSGPPTLTAIPSVGSKLVLAAAGVDGSASDYAFGVDTNSMWASLPQAVSGQLWRWIAGTTTRMSLSGTGVLSLIGSASISSTLSVTSTVSFGAGSKLGGYNVLAATPTTQAITTSYKFVEVNTAGNTVTMPAVAGALGYDFYIINTSTGAITVQGSATGANIGNTAAAALTYSLAAGGTLHLVSTGAVWRIL